MHWITRTAATVATTLALALPSVGVAQAGPAPAPASMTTVAAATCHYTVTGNDVAVRRAPDTTADVIKWKDRGNVVGGPCGSVVFNDGRWWTEVYLGSGGTGWMASAFLDPR